MSQGIGLGVGPVVVNWVRVEVPQGEREANFSLTVDSHNEEKITIDDGEGYREEFKGKGHHNIATFKRPRTKNLTYTVRFNEAFHVEVVPNIGVSSVYHRHHIIAFDKNSHTVNATVDITWILLPNEPPSAP
eukprot:Phypoly_transcript_27106.p1 GENE.Phypoly_transcript_27106~~Phypoly_transcript_27106.p1  ORF type:complete len:132 (+),score=14.14 Phypoly_transcript_27106:20-415(+)